MDDIDRHLLYMLAEAQRRGTAISTWQLASQIAKTSGEKNKLDGIFRYRLEQLVKKGLVTKEVRKKGTQKLTYYTLNPSKILCTNGSLFILANPILVIECPYTAKCKCEKLTIYKRDNQVRVRGCRLLKEAPAHIKETVLTHLSSP